jgi:hypothetical protein
MMTLMTRSSKIEVTQEHINNGVCSSPSECAVALALAAAFDTPRVQVLTTYAKVGDVGFSLPKKVVKFIRAFDKAKPVKPISFRLKGY